MSEPALPGLANFQKRFGTRSSSFTEIFVGETIDEESPHISETASSDDSIAPSTLNLPSRLHVAIFSLVLEDSLNKIKILGHLGGLPSVKTTLDYESIAKKYDESNQQSFIFDPETLEPYEGSLAKQMLIKFQKDRSYLEQVLEEANQELTTNFCLNMFMTRLRQLKQSEDERNSLLTERLNNITTLNNLIAKCENDKVNLSSDLQNKADSLWHVKDDYEDMIYLNDIKFRYIGNWENARCYQNIMQLQRQTEEINNTITEYENNFHNENRINNEIENFLTQTTQTYLADIETWMDKFDKDLEAKALDIQVMSEKRDEQLTRLHELDEIYSKRKKEIEDYLELKALMKKQEELLAEMNRAATKIQAWWRGTMYRKGLGRHRKRKGKKGKRGGGKKRRDKNVKGKKK